MHPHFLLLQNRSSTSSSTSQIKAGPARAHCPRAKQSEEQGPSRWARKTGEIDGRRRGGLNAVVPVEAARQAADHGVLLLRRGRLRGEGSVAGAAAGGGDGRGRVPLRPAELRAQLRRGRGRRRVRGPRRGLPVQELQRAPPALAGRRCRGEDPAASGPRPPPDRHRLELRSCSAMSLSFLFVWPSSLAIVRSTERATEFFWAATYSYLLLVNYYRVIDTVCCIFREISDMLPIYLNILNILIPNKTSI
jgi:hypothetical protein